MKNNTSSARTSMGDETSRDALAERVILYLRARYPEFSRARITVMAGLFMAFSEDVGNNADITPYIADRLAAFTERGEQ